MAETIASCAGMTTASKKVTALYERMLRELGPEFYILREAPLDDIARISSPIIAEGISRLREGRVTLAPAMMEPMARSPSLPLKKEMN